MQDMHHQHQHHEDYSRPLDTVLLCPSCHMIRHHRNLIRQMDLFKW